MTEADLKELLLIVETDQLIAELRDRFDRMLFVGVRALDEGNYDIKFRYKELPTDAIGLARYIEAKISSSAQQAEYREDEDDDD